MKKQVGYSWYYRCYHDETFDPDDTIYNTLEEAQKAMREYQKNRKSVPLSAYGIDKLENDEGYVRILEWVVVPTTSYWGGDD